MGAHNSNFASKFPQNGAFLVLNVVFWEGNFLIRKFFGLKFKTGSWPSATTHCFHPSIRDLSVIDFHQTFVSPWDEKIG